MKNILTAIFFIACPLYPMHITAAAFDVDRNPHIQIKDTVKQERTYTVMERELEYLMNIWPGEYDNVEQLDFDSYYGKKEKEQGRHLRFHAVVERINVPALGDYVIYTEAYINDDPSQIFGQSIYILSADDKAKRIRAKRYNFKKANPQRGTKDKGMDFLKTLKLNDERLNERCELVFERVGDEFVGRSPSVDCHKDMARNGVVMHFEIRIKKDLFAFRLPKYDVKTNQLLPDEKQTSWYMLEKARCFTCMIDFPREKGGRPVKTVHYITIHDQGGKFEFDYDDGRHMVLGMRNTWSLGMQRETFVIFIQEEDQKGPTLIYSWGNPGADRIGFNPGWIRVQCDLDTPKNRALQKGLRPDS